MAKPHTALSLLKRALVPATVAAFAALASGPAGAETGEIRIAQQFGIGYLPLQMMRERGLVEKHAAAQGLGPVEVKWLRFSGGRAMNDGLLSGEVDFASGGVGPLLTIWDKTKGNLNVKGVACLNLMPLYLNTSNPNVKTLKDFTEKDRIALPAVKVSIQARTLQMAAEKAFGAGRHDVLDKWTVSMKHPDGVAAILSGSSEITGHFTSPPFMYQELEDPRVHKVISSYDILGGPSTFNCVWARASFRDDNPKAFKAFVGALGEAMDLIAADQDAAAQVYINQTKSKLELDFIKRIVKDPEISFTMAPANTMKYAEFMHKVDALDNMPASWKDYFFPEIHDLAGS